MSCKFIPYKYTNGRNFEYFQLGAPVNVIKTGGRSAMHFIFPAAKRADHYAIYFIKSRNFWDWGIRKS